MRRIRVHVDLEQVVRGQDHDGPAEAAQRLAQLGAGRKAAAADQDLGAVAVVLLGRDLGDGRRVGHRVLHRLRRRQDGIALDQPHHALEYPDERLGAGVHHAGLSQDFEQLGRAAQRVLRLPHDVHHHLLQVVAVSRGPFRRVRRVAGDRQDGALYGLVEGVVQVVRAGTDGVGDVTCRGDLEIPERLAEAQEEVGEQHAGVAARAEHAGLPVTAGSVARRCSARTPSAAARRVMAKLVPVSPSGTGKTLMRLSSSRPASTQSAAASTDRLSRGPSRYVIPTAVAVTLPCRPRLGPRRGLRSAAGSAPGRRQSS